MKDHEAIFFALALIAGSALIGAHEYGKASFCFGWMFWLATEEICAAIRENKK